MRFSKLTPAQPSRVYDTFWRFAAERQEVFHRRIEGQPPPWTQDSILLEYKFTNAYRVSDRVSQYLIRNVIYAGDNSPEEVLFRILLFKTFNRIETWETLKADVGEISYKDYSFDRYDRVLSSLMQNGVKIYSGAYIMTSGRHAFGHARKHRNHLELIHKMISDGLARRVCAAKSMSAVFDMLLEYPTIGYFLAYQYAIDINYSELTHFSEMDFVVPGPGSLDGISKCFQSTGGLSPADIIRLVTDRQQEEFSRLDLRFRDLWGRPLQLIDVQNLFCEISKYARVAHPDVQGEAGRTRIKQRFTPRNEALNIFLPPKWGLRIPASGPRNVKKGR